MSVVGSCILADNYDFRIEIEKIRTTGLVNLKFRMQNGKDKGYRLEGFVNGECKIKNVELKRLRTED